MLGVSIGRLGRVGGTSSAIRDGALAAFMATQADGIWLDFTSSSRLFQEAAGTTPADDDGEVIGLARDRRIGPNSPHNATQSTPGYKPRFYAPGIARFDAVDDYHAPDLTTGAGENFIVAKVKVPASMPSFQIVAGSRDASATKEFWLGFTPAGIIVAGDGNGSYSVPSGDDYRGQTITFAVTVSGTVSRIFAIDAQKATRTQSGAVGATAPISVGAINTGGVRSFFFGGDVHHVLAGRQFLDLSTFQFIAGEIA